jgi:hypothetical protein
MTYIYTGILSEELYEGDFPADAQQIVYRKITHPRLNIGVLFPEQAENQTVKPDMETEFLVKLSGIMNGTWLYYMCWGGEVETVALAKVVNGIVLMETYEIYEDVSYPDLCSIFERFNLFIEKSGYFEPFQRNYWGEYGY